MAIVEQVLAAQASGSLTASITSGPDQPERLVTVACGELPDWLVHRLMSLILQAGSDAAVGVELVRLLRRATDAEGLVERIRRQADRERLLSGAIAKPFLVELTLSALGDCWSREAAARWWCSAQAGWCRRQRDDRAVLGDAWMELDRWTARIGTDPWPSIDDERKGIAIEAAYRCHQWPASRQAGAIAWEPISDFDPWARRLLPARAAPGFTQDAVLERLRRIDAGELAVAHPDPALANGRVRSVTTDGWTFHVWTRMSDFHHIQQVDLPDGDTMDCADIRELWPQVARWDALHPERWGIGDVW